MFKDALAFFLGLLFGGLGRPRPVRLKVPNPRRRARFL